MISKTDVAILLGLVLIEIGLWICHPAAALIFGGVVLCLFGWLEYDRQAKQEMENEETEQ